MPLGGSVVSEQSAFVHIRRKRIFVELLELRSCIQFKRNGSGFVSNIVEKSRHHNSTHIIVDLSVKPCC